MAVALAGMGWPGAAWAQPPAPADAKTASEAPVPGAAVVAAVAEIPAIIKVNATLQPYQPLRPWMKAPPIDRRGLGIIVGKGGVLVTAEMIADSTYVELEMGDSGAKCPATVVVADHSANLAFVKPAEEGFLKGIEPVAMREAAAGEKVDVCQIERTGVVLKTEGVLTTIEVAGYPAGDLPLLLGRVACSLQFREASFAVPVLSGDRLVGILMRYNGRTQDGEMIPVPVIRHFMAEAASATYRGFPRLGIGFSPMRDPQFRSWANVPPEGDGVYIQSVEKGSPAEKGGLRAGDILVEMDGKKIDRDGNYRDAKYGKLGISHLVATVHRHGEKLACAVLRSGKKEVVEVTVVEKRAADWVIPPYLEGEPPRYYILGGLVFLELSRTYLQQWRDWQKTAPRRFLYFEGFQSELFAGDDRERIVVLGQVLPSELTVGYEELSQLTVSEINGVRLKRLADIERAVAAPIGGMHRIEFEEEPHLIFLDAARAAESEGALKRAYGVRELKRLE
jgi:S1-C subfamily serine protease